MDEREALARKRFFMLQMIRLSGAFLALLGAIIISGRLIDIPELGYVLLVIGALDLFLVPNMISRSWRSKDR
ncbi:hypothetical protein LY632_12910 [Erythrobacter sp. SDW2]|uniref:hypothetical protein n=1 Tax=Erythrobacter sp. SDW2 TaxID=2907154 RepID=UPI001F1CDA44|nr:hypothetical protein [Erythrobacter sp. SDW2]UIP06574.1 hypothetical protein LY632_12910 [Erythrobacter sp. SDW2]